MKKFYTDEFLEELEEFVKKLDYRPGPIESNSEIQDLSDRDYLRFRIALMSLTRIAPEMLQHFVGKLDLRAYEL